MEKKKLKLKWQTPKEGKTVLKFYIKETNNFLKHRNNLI